MYSKNIKRLIWCIPLVLFVGAFLLVPGMAAAAGEVAVVQVDVANVRTGPDTNSSVLTQVSQSAQLPVQGKSGDWYQVKLADGTTGWVAGWLIALKQDANTGQTAAAATAGSGKKVVVAGDMVNVRSGPGTNNSVLKAVYQGDSFAVLEQADDWYRIALTDGSSGWIAGWLVSQQSATNSAIAAPAKTPAAAAVPAASINVGKTAVVTGSVVNIRSGPDTGSNLVNQVYKGYSMTVLEQTNEWYKVKLNDGSTGWVAGWLVALGAAHPEETPALPNNQNTAPEPPSSNNNVQTSSNSGKAIALDVTVNGDKTSIVLKADAAISYNSFYLQNPARLVVDLNGIVPGDLAPDKVVNSKAIGKVRIGHFQKNPDVTRVVFELNDGALCMDSLSSDKKTLTIDAAVPNAYGALRGKSVTIDPGHGGSDPGAVGIKGTKEKDITLDIAKQVTQILVSNGAKVTMSRSTDKDVGLYEIADIANAADTDIFVSIHINANNNRSIGGTSTYIHRSTDAAGKNRIKESDKLAEYVQDELVKSLGLRDIGVLQANFAVLRTTNMPAILVEVAFISNQTEEQLMLTADFRKKAAEAIAKGIGMYFAANDALK